MCQIRGKTMMMARGRAGMSELGTWRKEREREREREGIASLRMKE